MAPRGYMQKILQLKVFIVGQPECYNPGIKRVLQVPYKIRFYDLHCIIQLAFGWKEPVDHSFRLIFQKEPVISNWSHPANEEQNIPAHVDSRQVSLGDFLQEDSVVLYESGIDPDWNMVVLVEKVLAKEKGKQYPICIDGAKNNPPRQCFNLYEYIQADLFLRRKAPLYVNKLGNYDLDYFNANAITEELKYWRRFARAWEDATFTTDWY